MNNYENWEQIQEFSREFLDAVKSPGFKLLLKHAYNPRFILSAAGRNGMYRVESNRLVFPSRVHDEKVSARSRNVFQINDDKLSYRIIEPLQEIGLVSRHRDGHWWHMEKYTAMLYMSILAKYMAAADTEARMIPGTNVERYQRLSFVRTRRSSGFPIFDFQLNNVLPIPKEDVPFERILDFRNNRNRYRELERFQKLLLKFQADLSNVPDKRAMKDLVSGFKRDLNHGLLGLSEVLDESHIDMALGGLKSLIGIRPLAEGGLA